MLRHHDRVRLISAATILVACAMPSIAIAAPNTDSPPFPLHVQSHFAIPLASLRTASGIARPWCAKHAWCPQTLALLDIPTRDVVTFLAVTFGVAAVGLHFAFRRRVIRGVKRLSGELRHFVRDDSHPTRLHAGDTPALHELTEAGNLLVECYTSALRSLETHAEQLRASAKAVAQVKADAEHAIQSKNELFASISHEIRTPMTAILGYTDMLAEEGVSPEDRAKCVATIRRNGETLLAMISDVLDLAKLEAAGMRVEILPICPIEVSRDAFDLLKPIATKKKNIQYELVVDPNTPKLISGDSVRLKQILVNLIGNAIKFTESGYVRIYIRRSPKNAEHVQIDVLDSGIGMTGEQISRLFQPFVQAEASTTRRFGGTGLGLTISKRLAHLMSGDISVTSEPGRGSVFSVSIPVATAALNDTSNGTNGSSHRSIPIRPEPRPGQSYAGTRVLLAEDGDDNRRLLLHVLSKAGFTVETATNGLEAVEMLTSQPSDREFQLVLMDMSMPLMDGYEATAVLRRRGFRGPIIALTAHTGESQIQKCLDAGCDDYAPKPVDKNSFLSLCRRWIGQPSNRKAAA